MQRDTDCCDTSVCLMCVLSAALSDETMIHLSYSSYLVSYL